MTRLNRSWLPAGLFAAHLAALVFGLVGLLIMLPHPELWASDPNAVKVFDWSMRYAGSLHIVLGAATMLAVGVVALGWRKTAIFLAVATGLSLSSELIGTGTGWPFGNYAYTSFLGHKVLGRVPFTIPLSWFYMGLASYLLGSLLAARLGVRRRTAWSLGLGVWFLTVWDLVLDPAMAHHALRVQFWVWDESGPYFGMPIRNFVGWSLTGLLFMAIGRALWRRDVEPERLPMRFPLAVYAANVAFAMVLSAGVGLWLPILLAAALGVLPATLAVRAQPRTPRRSLRWAEDA
jgi:putative membrane protein